MLSLALSDPKPLHLSRIISQILSLLNIHDCLPMYPIYSTFFRIPKEFLEAETTFKGHPRSSAMCHSFSRSNMTSY